MEFETVEVDTKSQCNIDVPSMPTLPVQLLIQYN